MDNHIPSKKMKFRVRVIMTAIFVLLFGVVIVNFFRISVLDNKKYQAMANDQHFGSITLSANRGSIYDAKGTLLAKSATVYKVFIDPKRFAEDMKYLQTRIDKRNAEKRGGTYQAEIDEKTGRELSPLPDSADDFKRAAVSILSSKLDITAEKVEKAMATDSQYVELQTQVEKPVADEVLKYFTQYGFSCLNVKEDTKRYYPQNELAASVIGFTDGSGKGTYGVECSYNEYLAGIDGRTISAKDSNGNELPYRYSKTYPAKDGDDVYLTIDNNIQYIMEKYLKDMTEEFNLGNRSCAILMNAKTGAIYGMATYPDFDLNDPQEIVDKSPIITNEDLTPEETESAMLERQWRNKCITEIYEPGSVFKVITSAAAIEENLVNFNVKDLVCNGSVAFDGVPEPVKCHIYPGAHGAQSFQEALTSSCNPAFMELGKRLGKERFCYYFDAFGMRELSGIDLPAERSGKGITVSNMRPIDLAVSAFGQSETITPIEMITGYCAAINGGYLLKPYVVDKVVDTAGNVVLKNERTVRRQVISEETSAKMRECLENVVTSNNGGNVTIKGYSIGGKSGTSERISVDKDEYGSSYCCFTPADDPEIVLFVLGDFPDRSLGHYYGSEVAVPTARKILTEVVPYMGITPEYTDAELENLDVTVPLLEGSVENALATLEKLNLKGVVRGDNATVVAQSPQTGTAVAKGGIVFIYTDPTHTVDYTDSVPALKGLSPQVAIQSLEQADLNYVTRGASPERDDASVSNQSIEAGQRVAKGTVVEIEITVNSQGD